LSARRIPVLSFEVPATPASVASARHWVLAFAQEHSSDAELHARIALSFTEALTNAVRHAYDDSDPRDVICVAADVDDETLEIVVTDTGSGFRVRSQSDGLGAGLNIIAACTDSFTVREHQPSGTEIWMRFHLGPHS
jgi:anti-sigma regulatory factor (Ser/Thr protein kinase)